MEFRVFSPRPPCSNIFSRLRLKEAWGNHFLQLVAAQESFHRSVPASTKPCRRLGRLVGSLLLFLLLQELRGRSVFRGLAFSDAPLRFHFFSFRGVGICCSAPRAVRRLW
ncbi:unnamed protein product [Polarella glacialis]|uniref:Uncharacterized protein n=1 Tax=Polarella glacialis TaxID=89957 RepID=A0A813ECQ9_POLGL|nr:unnamed protein product [Polarella glacialis]